MALELVKRGVSADDIVVFDRARFPRPKLCGGALTFRGTEYLSDFIGQPEGGGTTLGLEFRCSLGEYDVIERGHQWIYDRALLDNELLRRVIDSGVEVRQETAVRGLERQGATWSIRTDSGTEAFDWVVGADGARGVVGRSVGLKHGIVGRLVEAVYAPEATTVTRPQTLIFDFDPIADGIPGYAWIFPYPKPADADGDHEGLFKIGVMDGRGVTSGSTLRTWTDEYAALHGYRRVDAKIAGWPEHYFSPWTRAHVPGVILVGEAWGIDPLLGEGIAPSFEMAMYAARRLGDAVRAKQTKIRGYERQFLFTRPGRNLAFHAQLADLLYGGDSRRWLRVLFGHEYMMGLAEAGTEAYGRLARRLPQLAFHYALQVLREGIPNNAPLQSRRSIERRGRVA